MSQLPVAQTPEGKSVTITQATVTLQAVKVNGKAMTIALFEQLPTIYAGDALHITWYSGTYEPVLWHVAPKPDVKPWGKVIRKGYTHLLVERQGILYVLDLSLSPEAHKKIRVEAQRDGLELHPLQMFEAGNTIASTVWQWVNRHPQLFIAV